MGRPSPNGMGCTTVSSPCPALAQSSAVKVNNTPGRFAAAFVDNARMRACACGLRTGTPRHVGQHNIVDVASLSLDEANILAAPQRLADISALLVRLPGDHQASSRCQ